MNVELRNRVLAWEEEFFLSLWTGTTTADKAGDEAKRLVNFCLHELELDG